MPPLKRLKQELFVQALTDKSNPKTFGNQTQSHKVIYHSSNDEVARSGGCEILAKPYVKNRLLEVMEQKGLTDSKLLDRHKDLLYAKKSIVVDKELIKVDDNSTSMEALKVAYKLKGHLNDMISVDARQVNLQVENPVELSNIVDEMKKLNEKLR